MFEKSAELFEQAKKLATEAKISVDAEVQHVLESMMSRVGTLEAEAATKRKRMVEEHTQIVAQHEAEIRDLLGQREKLQITINDLRAMMQRVMGEMPRG